MIVELLVKVTLILTGVTLGSLALRRTSAATRHLVQVLGLVAVLALPLAAAALPGWELPLLTPRATPTFYSSPTVLAAVASAPAGPARAATPLETEETPAECPCPASPLGRPAGRDDDALQLLAGGPSASPSSSPLAGAASVPWLGLVWLAGVAVVLGRLAAGWLKMTRLAIDASPLTSEAVWDQIHDGRRRLGVRGIPRVLTSSAVRVPALWGFARPTLLLPRNVDRWPTERLRAVLLHELAHLKRFDGLALLLGRVSAAVWWFHPLAWIVEHNARRDCESACDDVVLASGERPSTYARHLLEIVRELSGRDPVPAGALSLLGPGLLEKRLRAILRPGVRRGMTTRTAVAALSFIAVALVSVSSARLVARTGGTGVDLPEPRSPIADARFDDGAIEPADRREKVRSITPAVEPEILLAHDGDHGDDPAGREIYERAFELHRAERWAEAAETFREAAEAGFRPSTSLYNAACGHARLGQTDEALRLIQRSIDEGFDSYELLYEDSDLDPIRTDPAFRDLLADLTERKVNFGRRGDRLEEAVAGYDELVENGSDEGSAWYRVGSALLGVRDFDRGVDALERAADLLDGNNSNALYNLACAHSLQGHEGPALDYLERAVLAGFDSDERFENDSDLDNIRAQRKFAEIEALHDTLSLGRFREGGWNWGDGDYSSRRWSKAVDEYRAFVAERPDVGRAWFNLGWALHYSRRHAEAREAFEQQRARGFRPALATYNIACTHAMDGNNSAALDALERAVEDGNFHVGQLIGDDDLKGLHAEPRFEAILEQAADSEELEDDHDHHRTLDHWKQRMQARKKVD